MSTAQADRFLEMDKAETEMRKPLMWGPDRFDRDLTPLVKLQSEMTQELLQFLLKEGWPSINTYGWFAANAASRIARHSFTQPKFVRDVLPMIEQAARFGEVGGNWFTEHYDTIMFYENKPQVFGNILTWNQSLEVVPWTIAAPESVNDRRDAFGVEPLEKSLADRTARFNERYKKPESYEKFRKGFGSYARAWGWDFRD